MSISSLYLDAFLTVAKTKGFSSAAKNLNITQSAMSQKIKNLEDDLGLTLFIRTPTGATLTEQGLQQRAEVDFIVMDYLLERSNLQTEN